MVNIKNYQLDPEIFENSMFNIHLRSMRWHGLLIDTTQRYPLWHLVRGNFSALLFTWLSLLSLIKVSRGFEKLEDGAIGCALALSLLSFSIMVMNAYLQRARIVRLVRFIHEDLDSLLATADAAECAHYDQTLRYLRLVTIMLVVPTIAGCSMACLDCFVRTLFLPETVFNVPQILNGTAQPILLFKLFPFGEVYDNFVVGYLGPWFMIFMGGTYVPIWHTFITCLMKYVTVKLEIIGERMRRMDITKVVQHINPECDLKHLSAEELNYWRSQMCAFCVKEQVKIRWFVAELEALIRIPVFLDFILCSVQLCLLLYVLSTGISMSMDYCFMFLVLFILAFIQWLYYWHATLMAESSDALRFAVYSCDWYNYSLPVQKTIRLIMLGSNTPLVMRAFLVQLNLKTFINVVRGVYSYFNILRKHSQQLKSNQTVLKLRISK